MRTAMTKKRDRDAKSRASGRPDPFAATRTRSIEENARKGAITLPSGPCRGPPGILMVDYHP